MTTVNVGRGIELDIDFSKMPANSIEHFLKIGARNVFMDSYAPETEKKTPDEETRLANSRAIVEKKLAAMYAGDVRVSTFGPRGDAVARECKAIAAAYLRVKGVKTTADNYKELLEKVAAAPSTVEKAKARVAEAADLDVDVEI